MSTNRLSQAVTLIHAGKKAAAQHILLKYLQTDTCNENAWLWLAYIYTDPRRLYCLERALEINPHNLRTRQTIAKLNRARTPHLPALTPEILPRGTIIFSPNALSFLIVRPAIVHVYLLATLHGQLVTRYTLRYSGMFVYLMYIFTLLVFTILFLTPFYRVEITPTHLIGPARIAQGLARVKVPLKNLDLQNAPITANFFGLYSIPTSKGSKMLLLAFNKTQYQQLLDLIRARTILTNTAH